MEGMRSVVPRRSLVRQSRAVAGAAACGLALLAAAACTSGGARSAGTRGGATPDVAVPAAPRVMQYRRVVMLEQLSETSANASIGDVNGDGRPDIVLAKGRHWPLVDRVMLGDGRGGFAAGYDLGEASDRSYSGLLVDLDGDRDLDVVISNDRPDPKRIYLNDGAGHFSAAGTFGNAEWPTRNASVADLNGDGRPDIVVANRAGGRGANYICLNRGGGRFDGDCIAFSRESATTITPADVDGDGDIDLVVPNRDGGQSFVYRNTGGTGSPTFSAMPFGPSDANVRIAAVADLDGDQRQDIVVIDEARGAAAYFGMREGGYAAAVPLDVRTRVPYALAVADLNRDGLVDIVVGNSKAPSVALFNDGTGRHFISVPFGDDRGTVYGFAIGDVNGDGLPDIAAARSEGPNVVYLAELAAAKGR